MLGDIHLAVEFLDLLNEKSRFLSVVHAACLKAGDVGELRKGSRSGRAVILEDIGEYDCVCETVRSAVHSAEVVGYRVDVADISSGEGDTRKVGGDEHILSRLEILAVLVSRKYVVKYKSGRFLGRLCGALGVAVADISLNRVGQGVHAGGGGDVRGQADGKLGVEHCVFRAQDGILKSVFLVSSGVGDDCGNGGLRACACGGGHGVKGGQLLEDLEGASHLLHGLIGPCDPCGRSFGAVHG